MCRRTVTSDRPVILAAVAMVCDGNSERVVFFVFGKVVPLCCFAWKLEYEKPRFCDQTVSGATSAFWAHGSSLHH